MRILYAHNFYRQAGGEDETFADEIRILRAHGHEVGTFETSSKSLEGHSKLLTGLRGVWSLPVASAVAARVRADRPEIVHFHNTYPVMSPAAFRAARSAGAAVIHTLHNFRHLCSDYGLLRNGRPCEDCVGSPAPWRGIVHGCSHNGRFADAQIAVAVAVHRLAGTWAHSIDRYVALTPFARDIFVRGGFPADRVAVLPTFVDPDPGPGPGSMPGGGYALFVGRLVARKGVDVMLEAWRRIGTAMPLRIVGGGGPLAAQVAAAAASMPGVEFLGRVERDALDALVGNAALLVFPSIWYEGTPRTIAEAFAAGTPVIASDLGGMAAMVTPGVNGALFRAGDPDDLARVILALSNDGEALRRLRPGARRSFETTYSAASHYDGLIAIYRAAFAARGAAPAVPS